MRAGVREGAFAGVVGLVLVAGLAFDVASTDVDRVQPSSPAGDRFVARAAYCPPAVAGPQGARVEVSAAADGGDVTVGVEPQEEEPIALPDERALLYRVRDVEPASVTGYGGTVHAGAVTETDRPGRGAGAAPCAPGAAARWYFGAGSASIEVDQRFIIYNPFAAEAVVRIALFTPTGERVRASLADVAVPAGDYTAVELNKAIQVQRSVAAEIVAERGRVVAWRQLFATGGNVVNGLEFSLGAVETSEEWLFPDGALGRGATERISIVNPTEDEAVVTITLATGSDEALNPPDLMELAVPPRSQLRVGLARVAGEGAFTGVGAIVRSVNGVPVVAERTVEYDTDAVSGVAAEIGAPRAARRWLVPAAARAADGDVVAVLNPGTRDVTVSISFATPDGEPVAPEALSDLGIGPGGRLRIPVGEWTEGRPFVAFVDASGPVAAERFARVDDPADVAAVMGRPLTTPRR